MFSTKKQQNFGFWIIHEWPKMSFSSTPFGYVSKGFFSIPKFDQPCGTLQNFSRWRFAMRAFLETSLRILDPPMENVWTCIAGVGSSKYPVLRVQWPMILRDASICKLQHCHTPWNQQFAPARSYQKNETNLPSIFRCELLVSERVS